MSAPSSNDDERDRPVSADADAELRRRLGTFRDLHRRLRKPETVPDLLAVATAEGCRWCGFTRGVIASVQGDDLLVAATTTVIGDRRCEELREALDARPIQIDPRSLEAELIRRQWEPQRTHGVPSVLASGLGLGHHVVTPVMPESRVVALMALDRPAGPVDDADRMLATSFATSLGLAIERVVLRARMHELFTEVRAVTASTQALIQEALAAPVDLTSDYGLGPVFTAARMFTPDSRHVRELLTEREQKVAALIVEGRANREIAEELHVSIDTVKAHVTRLLRKLGANNRAHAAVKYTRLLADSSG